MHLDAGLGKARAREPLGAKFMRKAFVVRSLAEVQDHRASGAELQRCAPGGVPHARMRVAWRRQWLRMLQKLPCAPCACRPAPCCPGSSLQWTWWCWEWGAPWGLGSWCVPQQHAQMLAAAQLPTDWCRPTPLLPTGPDRCAAVAARGSAAGHAGLGLLGTQQLHGTRTHTHTQLLQQQPGAQNSSSVCTPPRRCGGA